MTHNEWARRVVKPAVFLACLIPFAQLVYGAFLGDLGANPVETITNTTGIWTLRLVVTTVAITPARWLTKWNVLIRFRRMLGLFAFFYGSMHFLTYFVLDQSLQFGGLWEDVMKRPYITMGFTAFVLLIPLALTSTQASIRWLGGRRWNLLHRLVYITAMCAVVHYWWKVKVDTTYPMYYALTVATLLGVRVWRAVAKRQTIAASRHPAQVVSSAGLHARDLP
ncbi:MAG TPA: protein-methionine-sulfoxide reductase heme-binding subunit MsrQ [Vicinamibacterales bacterium]|nr:protein-methionine-sulfoxide reductase heme-binding subunit MsrQ [Vicinamibacterales bacterium]